MITLRPATDADVPLLATLNHQLIRDQGHRNSMTVPELEARMRRFLHSEGYTAVLFERDGDGAGATAVVAYALYRPAEDGGVYLRQFFVTRDARRIGVGREAIRLLRAHWPAGIRITVDVLPSNEIGQSFWRSLGFTDYSLTLELRN